MTTTAIAAGVATSTTASTNIIATTTSRRLADRKIERFEKNITKRGAVPETTPRKGSQYPVGPILLGFFVFVVIGSSSTEKSCWDKPPANNNCGLIKTIADDMMSLGTIVDGYICSICGTHDRALDHGYKARSFMRDFWVLETNQWEQLNYKGCPSPRSGHRMILYKHKIIVFGGFYDTLREVRVPSGFVTHLQLSAFCSITMIFMYLYLDQYKWQEIKSTSGCMWQSARSGFQDEGNDQLEQNLHILALDVEIHLDAMGLTDTIKNENQASNQHRAKAMIFLHHHLDEASLKKMNNNVETNFIFEDNVKTMDLDVADFFEILEENVSNLVVDESTIVQDKEGSQNYLHDSSFALDDVFSLALYRKVFSDVMMSLFLYELYGFQLDTHRCGVQCYILLEVNIYSSYKYPLELRKEKATKPKPFVPDSTHSSSAEPTSKPVLVDAQLVRLASIAEPAQYFPNSNLKYY
ncbi:putative acetate--CoA ligase ACS, chloroplastic/glyoxysomal-like [Capsicum annuum]|nr:putative acetate--CoA ligase ACS, chloroplastic/glyoxysomal-like [Capsicum annuum]